VPSGASTGTYEALELRDKDHSRYLGMGVLKAVENVNTFIRENILGMDAQKQEIIDKKLIRVDGTENKEKLGANAILGVSLAVCRAAALENNLPLYKYIVESYKLPARIATRSVAGGKAISYKLPIPMFNVINGGKHSDSGLSIQEFQIIPNGVNSFREKLRAGSEIFHALADILSSRELSTAVGDEGGYAPRLESNEEALEIISQAVEKAGYKLTSQITLGIDAAATSFYNSDEEKYVLKPENAMLSREMLSNIYQEWIRKFSVISIEDGLAENDWNGWRAMQEKFGKEIMLIGDDLIVTNVKRLKTAIAEKAANAVLVKVNQIGTLTETIECIKLAKRNKMKTIISHRSGETTDDFIADLAVGAGADFIKSGAPCRGERVAKYNRLLKIEEEII
jgi:enolase